MAFYRYLFIRALLGLLSASPLFADGFPYEKENHCLRGKKTTLPLSLTQAIKAQIFGTVTLTLAQQQRLFNETKKEGAKFGVWRHFDAQEYKECSCELANFALLLTADTVEIPHLYIHPDRNETSRGFSFVGQMMLLGLLIGVIALVAVWRFFGREIIYAVKKNEDTLCRLKS